MQEIKITDIVKRARDIISTNAALQAFSVEKYGKAPFLFVASDELAPPDEETMPHIVLLTDEPSKIEGAAEKKCGYYFGVAWAVKDLSTNEDVNLLEYLGLYNCDDMGELIWQSLRSFSPNFRVSRNEYTVHGSAIDGVFAGAMLIEILVPQVIGANRTI